MTLIDFHTHHQQARQALISMDARDISPQAGKVYSVGLHPWRSAHVSLHDLERLNEAARCGQVLAIGETGIDTLRGASVEEQTMLFRHHVTLAQEVGKPLIVHSVRSAQQVIKTYREQRAGGLPLAVHGFRGNERVAQMLLKEGFYLSFGARFNAAALAMTPADRMLIETDSDPVNIHEVAAMVALSLGIDERLLLRRVAENCKRFLCL